MKDEGTCVQYVGGGVWVAYLDQDAVEDIAHYLVIGARHCTHPRPKVELAAMFREALDAAFPDGAQDPAPALGG